MYGVLISEILGPVDGPWILPETPTLKVPLRLLPAQPGFTVV